MAVSPPTLANTTALLETIVARLTESNNLLEQYLTAQTSPTIPQPEALRQSIQLPTSPSTLNLAVFASQSPGVAVPQFLSYATAVPAGGSATVSYQVPTGFVLLFVGPFTLDATYYDPAITATLVVDTVNVLYEDYPIAAAKVETLPQYGVVRRSLEATYVNATTTPSTIITDGEAILLQSNIYDDIILPLLKANYNAIERYAEDQVALGEVS